MDTRDNMENKQLKNLLELYRKSNRFGPWLGMDFTIEDGQVIYTLKTHHDHLATPEYVHGGVLAALMDAVMGVTALNEVYREGKLVATIEMKLNYLRPVKSNQVLQAKAKIVSKGKRIIILEGFIFNETQEMVSIGTGTFTTYSYSL